MDIIFRYPLLKHFCYAILFTSLLYSCVTQKNLEYLHEDKNAFKAYNEAFVEEYKLKPDDELYIQINSLDDPSSNVFSVNSAQQLLSMGTIQPYGASLISHTIDKEGFLLLPVIGRISAAGKTTSQVGDIITQSLTNILSQPMVSVKLVNRYVTVIGEVRNPGHFAYAQDKLTVFDALGMAGDITDYGNRKEVIMTRNENGKNIRIPVNLTKSELMASNNYYVRPNDIIYVKPLRKKFWGLREFPYSVLLSTITTGLLIYSAIK